MNASFCSSSLRTSTCSSPGCAFVIDIFAERRATIEMRSCQSSNHLSACPSGCRLIVAEVGIEELSLIDSLICWLSSTNSPNQPCLHFVVVSAAFHFSAICSDCCCCTVSISIVYGVKQMSYVVQLEKLSEFSLRPSLIT